jgi:hypothetical protein
LIAVAGWLFILVARQEYLVPAGVVLASGALVYPLWRRIVGGVPGAPGR